MNEISVLEAKKLILENRHNPRFVILDVRTPEEFEDQHIPGALNINISDDDFEERITNLERGEKYLVHCRSGTRSAFAVEFMTGKGFSDVTNVLGWLF